MKKYIGYGAAGLLSSYAVLHRLTAPLSQGNYAERVNYIRACLFTILGDYSFPLLLLAIALGFFFGAGQRFRPEGKMPGLTVLSALLSAVLVLGQSLETTGDLRCAFGWVPGVIMTLLMTAGYFLLLLQLLRMVFFLIERGRARQGCITGFWAERPFLKSFLLLAACNGPILLLSYPGNLCYDIWGQLSMIIGEAELSTHHPLLHTLIAGGLASFGKAFLGSYEKGIFLYMILQDLLFFSALAATISFLQKRGASGKMLTALQLLYLLTPVYSNMASTAIKDVPFVSCFLLYMLFLTEVLTGDHESEQYRAALPLLLTGMSVSGIFVILFRNNGRPLLLLSLLLICIGLLRRRKEVPGELFLSVLLPTLLAILVGSGVNFALAKGLDARTDNTAEILSIPMQQTARYLQLYRGELTDAQRSAVEAVWGDVSEMAASYDPKISDPVKALYRKDCGASDLMGYFDVWLTCFFRHPGVYFDAFAVHIYGWLDPAVSNSVRYEASDLPIEQEGLFPGASRFLMFFYRMLGRFSPLAVLENVGVWTWILFLLTYGLRRKRSAVSACDGAQRAQGGEDRLSRDLLSLTLIPLYVSLLICIAAPAFFLHPRYAFPIMFTLPYLTGMALLGKNAE
ncbi:MAG: DUF6020 family protein [Lachnospiraceae bacterium]|nr:DUF6020 family protein [Lachnospiraceae bacterium]